MEAGLNSPSGCCFPATASLGQSQLVLLAKSSQGSSWHRQPHPTSAWPMPWLMAEPRDPEGTCRAGHSVHVAGEARAGGQATWPVTSLTGQPFPRVPDAAVAWAAILWLGRAILYRQGRSANPSPRGGDQERDPRLGHGGLLSSLQG